MTLPPAGYPVWGSMVFHRRIFRKTPEQRPKQPAMTPPPDAAAAKVASCHLDERSISENQRTTDHPVAENP